MVTLEHVSKHYDGTAVLGPLDLAIPPQRTTVLIGPSGCGKSTLIRIVNGLVQPDTGRVLFGGQPLEPKRMRRARQRMGYVIQEGGLFPHLTARRNVALLPRHLGWPEQQITHRIADLSTLVRLPAAVLDRYPAQLSGGQRQRVALMRALVLDPDLLLLDEPLGALDPMIRFALQVELKSVFARLGKTVLMVTHDMAEAGYFADLIVLMRRGRVVQQGTLTELIESPHEPFVEHFMRAQRAPVGPTR